MSDPPTQPLTVVADADPDGTAVAASDCSSAKAETLQLPEETLLVSKQEVLTGIVRVSTRTESVEEVAEVSLDRGVVDVTRVAVGRIVEVAPVARTEGDTTIVPVIEERFVVVKQLFLKEELHIRRRVETEVSHIPVVLRRQVAVVDRIDVQGRTLPEDRKPDA